MREAAALTSCLNLRFSLTINTLFNLTSIPSIIRSASAPYIICVVDGSQSRLRAKLNNLCSPSPGTSQPENMILSLLYLGSSIYFLSIKNLIY